MFNKSLKIGEGQKNDLTKVSQEGISLEELAKKNKKLIDIFKAFDLNGDNKLNDIELAKAMDAFSRLDDGDGKLSKKELEQGAKMFNDASGLDVKGNDLKSFIKEVLKLTKDDAKVNTQSRIQLENNLQEMKANAVVKTPAVETPLVSNGELKEPVKKEPETFDYTVQNGESYNGLIKRILKEQGIENPTKEDIAKAKAEFEKNNPGAVKKNAKGIEFLNVGAKVKIGADLGDKNNADEQIGKYADEASKRDEVRKENAKYNTDAFYRNKDGSEGRHLKLKPTGEKAENGRYWAVDKQGNKYLIAHDGTILDSAKVAKKDAAISGVKERAGAVNTLISQFNTAKKSFDAQVAKDGWAANTADAISGFFGSTNTEDNVRADMDAYKKQLNGLKDALMSGDESKFKAKFKEIYGVEYNAAALKDYESNPTAENYKKAFGDKQDIGARVAKYNESQETGGKVVKGVTVGVISGIAAVATGGSSLLVTAAVAGGSTFVASTAAETIDLATNDIDGDVNAENMGKIVEQASTEALFSATTAGLLKGGSSLWSKGAGKVISGTADDAVNAGQKGLPSLVSGTADDAANAGAKAGAKAGQKGLPSLVSGTADDAANAGAKAGAKAGQKGLPSLVSNTADDAANAGAKAGAKAGSNAGAGAKFSSGIGEELLKTDLGSITSKLASKTALSQSEKSALEKLTDMPYEKLMNMTKAEYRKLAVKFHPDKWSKGSPEEIAKSQEMFQLINNIFNKLF